MGKPSRDKGKRGEREFASLCREHGYDAHRTAQHMGKDGGQPDVIGLPGLHVEVKRCESLSLYTAIDQAKRDAKPDSLPIVAHRRNNHDWVVAMPAHAFFEIYREWENGR